MNRFILPQKKNIFKTNVEDPAYYYYIPFIGYFYKIRLINSLSMLSEHSDKLLDIGYGCGIFFPSLYTVADKLHGIETHGQEELVYDMLNREQLDPAKVELAHGSILNIPYEADFFDTVICISVLEHIKDLDLAIGEIYRVLRPGGTAVLSFPARNTVTDVLFTMMGFSPRKLHPSSHADIIDAVKKKFKLEETLSIPVVPYLPKLYYTIKCKK